MLMTAYEFVLSIVGSMMCIKDRCCTSAACTRSHRGQGPMRRPVSRKSSFLLSSCARSTPPRRIACTSNHTSQGPMQCPVSCKSSLLVSSCCYSRSTAPPRRMACTNNHKSQGPMHCPVCRKSSLLVSTCCNPGSTPPRRIAGSEPPGSIVWPFCRPLVQLAVPGSHHWEGRERFHRTCTRNWRNFPRRRRHRVPTV